MVHLQRFTDGWGTEEVMKMYRRYQFERGRRHAAAHEAQIRYGYIALERGTPVGCVYICKRDLSSFNLFDIATLDGYNFIGDSARAYRAAREAIKKILRHAPCVLYTFAAPGREEIISLVRPFGFAPVKVNEYGVLLKREA